MMCLQEWGRGNMKFTGGEYLGGAVSLLLLVLGILLLPFGEAGLPRIFALSWVAVALLPTIAFFNRARRKEQLSAARKRQWKDRSAVSHRESAEIKNGAVNQYSRENNED